MALNKNVAVTDSGTGYQYKPPVVNKKQEEEWTKQSLAKQAAEKVENQNSVAPPPKTTPAPIVSNPTYTNPVGASDALSRSEAKINPYVNPKPAYQGALASGELSKPTPQAEFRYEPAPKNGFDPPTNNIPYGMYGSTAQDPWGTTSTYNNWNLPKENPNPAAKPYGEFGSTAYDPWGTLTPYQYAKLSVPQPQGPQMSGMGLYGTGINTLVANANKQAQVNERLRQWFMLNPNATEAQYQAMKKSLETSVSNGSSYQGAMASGELAPATRQPIPLTGSLPPEGAGNFAPATTQPATQDDLLSAALAAQKSPYQGAAASGELAGAISTPTGTTTPYERPYGSTPIRTKFEGQPWNNGWKLPWKQGGYTEEELILAGNNYVGKYDNKAQYELRGKNQYEGYYLAPNGNYYPVNQNKAEYAISRGAANLSQSKFNSPEYMDYYYDGYSSDVDDFVRAFGTENLWRYDPNWKNAGLKYSNPTSWNTGSGSSGNGSSGNGASGNLGNNQQDGRGWYFNPAVNWAT